MTTPVKQTNKFEEFVNKRIDPIGQFLMGELWRDVYETIQDAIALSLLFVIPGAIVKFFTGVDYSDFDQCLAISVTNVSRYACFVIVSSGFVLWAMVAGRILGRTIKIIIRTISSVLPKVKMEEVQE